MAKIASLNDSGQRWLPSELELFHSILDGKAPNAWSPYPEFNANWRDRKGFSLAYACALRGNVGILAELLEAGARTSDMAGNGYAPLHAAAHSGEVGCMELLLGAGALIDQRTANGDWALKIAVCEGHARFVEAALALGSDARLATPGRLNTALHFACIMGQERCAQALLAAGADPDAKNSTDNAPIHFAVQVSKGPSSIAQAAMAQSIGKADPFEEHVEGKRGCLAALIAAGARLSEANGFGETPLMLAAKSGAERFLPQLFSAGALPSEQELLKAIQVLESGSTPMEFKLGIHALIAARERHLLALAGGVPGANRDAQILRL